MVEHENPYQSPEVTDASAKSSVPSFGRYRSLMVFLVVGIVLGTVFIGGAVTFHPSVSLPMQIIGMAIVGGPVGGVGGLAVWIVYQWTQRS
jgi:hypothetical protein